METLPETIQQFKLGTWRWMVGRNTYYYIVSFWHLGPIFRGKKLVSGRVLPPGWWRSLGRRGETDGNRQSAVCILVYSNHRGFHSTQFKRSIRKTLGNFPTEHRGMPFAYCIWLYSKVDWYAWKPRANQWLLEELMEHFNMMNWDP